jgi:hypothetical protein
MTSKKQRSENPEKYGLDLLIGNAEALFGVRPEAAAGALHGIHQTALSLDEARSLVQQFMKRKVK